MKRIIRRVLLLLLAGLLLFGTLYIWPRLPIITAFAAKGMCSSVFLADKSPDRVMAEDLSFFPISMARCEVDYEEKSVTARALGLAKRKAVFREGLGSVLVLDRPEEELRSASFAIPDPGYDPDTIAWPKGNIMPEALPEGVDLDRLEEIMDDAVDDPGAEAFKKTLGLAVVYRGQLIGEHYLDGYDHSTRFIGWSMTKTLTGAMAGALVAEGRLDMDAPADVPEWASDERSGISNADIFYMSSGLDWVENYFTISEATVMLMQSDNMFTSASSSELAHEPGSHWNYSSGDANLLSGLLRRAIGDEEEYLGYAYTRILHRIGMLNTVVETDASGLFVASSYSYGTTRDWARFGLLFLNNGVFEGDTVLQPSWVDYMRKPVEASGGQYAGTFWLKEPSAENALVDVPDDIFFADGFLGQRVYIIPSEDLVVVRMGYSLSNISMNDLLADIIATLP